VPEPPQARRRDAVVALLALLPLLAWDATGADLPLSRLFGDAGGFAWRNHWLLLRVLHDGSAWVLQAVFVVLGLNVLRPLPLIGALPRTLRLRWWLMTLLCALAISLLKRQSLVSCPWSLAQFGGGARLISHLSPAAWWGAGDGGPGRCFPAGHVSNAFAYVGGAMALRAVSVRAARVWLAAVCALGLLLGLTQLLRGAHFASHSLWTAWLCFVLSALVWHGAAAAAAMRQTARHGSDRHPGHQSHHR
jgi:membrane-associated PAP2 superfamily phosphatase